MAATFGLKSFTALKYLGVLGATVVLPMFENSMGTTPADCRGGIATQQPAITSSALDVDFNLETTSSQTDLQKVEISPNSSLRDTVRYVSENREMLSSILSVDIPPISQDRVDLITQTVVQCFEDKSIMSAIRTKIRALPPPPQQLQPIPSEQNTFDVWSQMIGSHKCCMCLDLLAAPCILSCGHSFCGECITDHLNRCVAVENDDGIKITLTCPMCRSEINGRPTFERVLDEDIGNKVLTFPDCPEKRDWSYRRETFKTKLLLNDQHQKKKGRKSHSHMDSRNSHNSSGEDDDDATADIVATIALAVVVFIVFYKFILTSSKS